jgi:hypothetical protein
MSTAQEAPLPLMRSIRQFQAYAGYSELGRGQRGDTRGRRFEMSPAWVPSLGGAAGSSRMLLRGK